MEKRQFSRVDYHVHVVVSFDGESFPADVENISLHGVLLRSGYHFPLGRQLELTLSLASTTPPVEIRICGESVRQEGNLLAVSFSKIDLDSFVHLRNIVSICKGDADSVMDEFMDFVGSRAHETSGGKEE